MSTRERWIVYPLLFLALGIAMRDKVIKPSAIGTPGARMQAAEVKAGRIRCNQLIAQEVQINGPNGRPVVVAGINPMDGSGIVETLNANGFPLVQLCSSNTGGIVKTIGFFGKLLVYLGHIDQNFGVFAELPEKKERIVLTSPIHLENKLPTPSQPRGSAAPSKPPVAVPQPMPPKTQKPGTDAKK